MLDYKKLSRDFTDRLNQFDKDRLEQWVSFDLKREILNKLLDGENVLINVANVHVSKLVDPRENINLAGESNYALAA